MATKITSIVWNSFPSYVAANYQTADAIAIADNIVSLQRSHGGWGKNVDPDYIYSAGEMAALVATETSQTAIYDQLSFGLHSHAAATLDEGTTGNHVRYLLRAAQANSSPAYKTAALSGIAYIRAAQYANGGFPQCYPNTSGYGGRITLNDSAMQGVMYALLDAASGSYGFTVDTTLQKECLAAFNAGVQCLLDMQIVRRGVKTAWCGQHDQVTLAPAHGRSYEVPGIYTFESRSAIEILQRAPVKTFFINQAILDALQFFNRVKIYGIEVLQIYGAEYAGTLNVFSTEDLDIPLHDMTVALHGYDRQLQRNQNAPCLWARIYDIDTLRPAFCGWDLQKRFNFSGMDLERRSGYLWLSNWLVNLHKLMPYVSTNTVDLSAT